MRESRWGGVFETAVCGAIVLLVAIHALWKMDYLRADTAHTVRMTDNSRSAYVAKNLAEGNGYTTNDLPASLVDFYDTRGKLDDARWANADRFPFTAYAIAGLYRVTGSTSYETGILLYNLICFVAFLVLLYRLTREVWGERYAAVFAVGLALLHPYTYVYLYWKDSDMLALTAACLIAMYRYFRLPPGGLGWRGALWLGTLFGWSFLARPNLGGSFIIFFALVALHRLWTSRGSPGLGPTLRDLLKREGLVALAVIAWVLPFAIHSMSEWGSPLFSANGIYQLPLGTRFGMGTDTWWKYTEPGHPITLGGLLADAPDDVIAKLTTSWLVTLKFVLRSYAIELILACGLAVWLGRRATQPAPADAPAEAQPPRRAFRMIVLATAFALVVNLALLPLYSYQDFNWRHYIGFALPLLWAAAGYAIFLLGQRAHPQFAKLADHVRAHSGAYLVAAIVLVLVWNFGSKAPEGNALFVRTSQFVGRHWLTSGLVLLGLLAHRLVLRGAVFPRVVAVVVILVFARYQPHLEMKRYNLMWFPATDGVDDVLRQRPGIVSSLALQGEVAWMSDRKNIPAPELVTHLYSYTLDHRVEIEDVYIESADVLLAPGGPFSTAAPGFEGYARLQRFRGRLPGYDVVLHEVAERGYAKYKIKPISKASTVYRLTDRAAWSAFTHSPDAIAVGDVANVVHTAFGFGEYYTVDGRPVVAATDGKRKRYRDLKEQPWEDTAITFLLDDRQPTSVRLEVYAPAPVSLELYWNLDLFAYDHPGDRKGHLLGSHAATAGWNVIEVPIPPALGRKGVNKLGFRAGSIPLYVVCPPELSEEACLLSRPHEDKLDLKIPVRALRIAGATSVTNQSISVLAATVQFQYGSTGSP